MASRKTPGWKASPSAPPPPPPTGWRYPSSPAVSRRRLRVGRLLAALLLVLGAATFLVWLLLWLVPPGPACLLVLHAGYEDNLAVPHNAPGHHAADRLADLARSSQPLSSLFDRSGRLRLARDPAPLRLAGDWARPLEQAREKTLVVYIAAHGGADAKGAYLLPHDAGPAEEDRLRLDRILARLKELPAKKNKLLILDASGCPPRASLGMLSSDFAAALDALDEQIAAVPNLVVLSAAGPGQRSWPTADGRTTLFAHHLEQGLAGAALPQGGRLDAWGLFGYLRDKVEADARRLHAAAQAPVLLPRGDGRRRARALPMTFRLSVPPAPPPGNPAQAIDEAWREYHDFARTRGSAAVACAPLAWRLWRAWLVRHEELRLAGADDAAVALDRARQARDRLLGEMDLGLASARTSLAMPALAGEDLTVPANYRPFERLWNCPPADREACWKQLLAQAGPAEPVAVLRRRIQARLISRAGENPAANLAKAAQLARLVDAPSPSARPAEVHFLIMLARDLAVKPPDGELADLVSNLLHLRLAAERCALAADNGAAGPGLAPTHAYAERVRAWIRPAIALGDRERQKAQDLAFAADADEWKKAGGHLARALAAYSQARGDAAVVRQALAARDRALLELGDHLHWLGQCRTGPDDAVVKFATGLFTVVRRLEEKLVDVPQVRDPNRLRQLGNEAKTVNAGLDRLQTDLDSFARRCVSTSPLVQRQGSGDVGVVLGMPALSADLRRQLVRQQVRRGARPPQDAEDDVVDAQAESAANRRRAIQRGQLALAALDGDAQAQAHLDAFARDGSALELRKAGDQVGRRFRQQLDEMNRDLAAAESAAARALPEVAEQQTAQALQRADRLARRLDAGQCVAARDASGLFRRASLQSLLVWLAERAWRDRWWSEDAAATPYYRIAGSTLLSDVRRVAPFLRDGTQAVPQSADVMRQRLQRNSGVDPAATPRRFLITGERLFLDNTLVSRADERLSGYPLLWAEPGDDLQLDRLSDARRVPIDLDLAPRLRIRVGSAELDKTESAPPPLARPRPARVVWRSYYRGQVGSSDTRIDLLAVPQATRTAYPPEGRPAVAIRAGAGLIERHGVAQGALAIVLDCSGSMGPPPGEAMTEATRFRQVQRALRTVLRRVPRGTSVSVWTFGQAVPPRNTVANAEQTITQLQEPLTWTGRSSQVDAILEKVEALTPWNESPIVRTMIRAKEDLTRSEGFRTLVVLSDGADNRIAKDRAYNPDGLPAGEVIRKHFAGSGIAIHVVGFQVGDKKEEEYRKQFEVVGKLTPRGSLTSVEKLDELIQVLSGHMEPDLLWRLVGKRERSGLYEATRTGLDDRWVSVPADSYQLRVTTGWRLSQGVLLRPGDRLLLRLYSAGRDPACERLLYSLEEPFRRRPAVTCQDWRVAVLQNQFRNEGGLQMLISLERAPRPSERLIRQVRPGDVWLECGDRAVEDGVAAMTWSEVHGYPAPCWGLDVAGWPAPAGDPRAPRVQVWWAPDEAPGLSLRRPEDWKRRDQLVREWSVFGEAVHIDSVAVEERSVLVSPGTRQRRACLVVRATHLPGRPIWVRPEGKGLPPLAGQEHRHYDQGRYAGLFWFANLDREQLERLLDEELTGIEIVSVPALKREAEGRQLHADFNDLAAPATMLGRPTPVTDRLRAAQRKP